MAEKPLHHGRDHRPGGEDPIPGLIYVDDQVLVSDTDVVQFEGFPSDASGLEITWNCWMASGADYPAVMGVLFNDDYPVPASDYWWRLTGSVELDTASDGSDTYGGLGLFAAYEEPCWGRVRFPDYARDSGLDVGVRYLGEGAGNFSIGGGTPDAWQATGYAQDTAVLTKISVIAVSLDTSINQNFEAGSRFTLTAY